MNDDISRLMELGLGIGIAQQMVKSMNYALQNTQNTVTYMPGAVGSIPAKQYFAVIENNVVGPCNEEEISKLICNGAINKDTFMWRVGFLQWQRAANIPEIAKLLLLNSSLSR